jgi:two-component system, OmpR family, phosphate regulon sensor histidine kinase PhoR
VNKKGISAVIILMGLSLLGIIGFQLYWIQQAYLVKEEQFDRGVQEALNQVATKLETHEAVDVIRDQMQHFEPPAPAAEPLAVRIPATGKPRITPAGRLQASRSQASYKARFTLTADTLVFTKTKGKKAVKSNPNAWVPATKTKHQPGFAAPATLLRLDTTMLRKLVTINSVLDTVWWHNQVNQTFFRLELDTVDQVLIQVDSLRTHILPALSRQTRAYLVQRDSATTRMALPGAARTPGAGTIYRERILVPARPHRQDQAYAASAPVLFYQAPPGSHLLTPSVPPPAPVPGAPEPARPVPGHQVNREKTVRQVQGKTDKFKQVIQQMAVEYVRKSLPLDKRLTKGQLDTLLRLELANQGVYLAYDFAVLHNGQAAYRPLQTAGFRPSLALDHHQVRLFPNDIEAQTNFLALHFPSKNRYILHSLRVMMVFSALFTIIILSTFLVSIYTILKQKKISEVKNDFINNMTHEFKTPLATISLAIDSINNPKVLENQDRIRHYAGIIREENKRMNKQVENVLQMALLDKQELNLDREPVDMHALIDQAVQNMALLLENKGGTIVLQLQATDFQVWGDEAHLGHVISNLLDNAIKYSPQQPDITLATANTRAGLLIAVEDKGLGMSKETQRKIFEKFYRVSTGNIHTVKGFGLGLSYVKAIMLAHKGSVSVKSEPGRGSRFELVLPLKSGE